MKRIVKKVLLLLCAALLMGTLVACGGTESKDDEKKQNNETVQDQDSDNDKKEEKEENGDSDNQIIAEPDPMDAQYEERLSHAEDPKEKFPDRLGINEDICLQYVKQHGFMYSYLTSEEYTGNSVYTPEDMQREAKACLQELLLMEYPSRVITDMGVELFRMGVFEDGIKIMEDHIAELGEIDALQVYKETPKRWELRCAEDVRMAVIVMWIDPAITHTDEMLSFAEQITVEDESLLQSNDLAQIKAALGEEKMAMCNVLTWDEAPNELTEGVLDILGPKSFKEYIDTRLLTADTIYVFFNKDQTNAYAYLEGAE